MINFICAEAKNNAGSIAIYVVLIVVLVIMLIMPFFTQRKRNKDFMNMISAIKVGDLVETGGGVIGRITKITDKGEIKTVIIETGSKTEKSYLEFDMAVISRVLKSTKAEGESDKTEETETKLNKKAEKAENVENSEEVKVDAEESVKSEETETEKAPEKKTRKTSVKKSSKK